MELSKQVISLDLAKQLKELGVKQDYGRGDYVWFHDELVVVTIHGSSHSCREKNELKCECECGTCYPYANEDGIKTFGVAELGEMFPAKYSITSCKRDNKWVCDNYPVDTIPEIIADTEANARGLMLKWLVENKKIVL